MNVQSTTQAALLSVTGLKKHFGGVKALDGVDLCIRPGEVHALVGENGAGKSTLIKVLTGLHLPTGGEITYRGDGFQAGQPQWSKEAGIQVVHQEFNLLEHLSIAENISIEALPRTRLGFLDKAEMHMRAQRALELVGLSGLSVERPISSLGIAHKQLVEIARALQTESRLLILDEPTATLTEREKTNLFKIVAEAKLRGVAVLFVSHHLDEVFDHCDRVTVFRNGRTVTTKDIPETSPAAVVAHMVGRHVDHTAVDTGERSFGDVVLATDELISSANRTGRGVSIRIRSGEILGIAGLVGAGRTEFLRSIFAAEPPTAGRVLLDGAPVEFRGPRDAIDAGLGFVTEDRKHEGLILDMSIAANASMVNLKSLFPRGWLSAPKEAGQAEEYGRKLALKYGKSSDPAASLSGGNQQKVVLSKWLANKPRVLLLDEPTRGVDVGAKFEIYTILRELAAEGVAMLIVSSELPELMALSDRISVMSNHQIAGTLERQQFSQEAILKYAYGQAS